MASTTAALRHLSLGTTQPQSSRTVNRPAFAYAHSAPQSTQVLSNQTFLQRSIRRPPVPLFHSNSTGDFAVVQQQQKNFEYNDSAMGGGANVAYHETMEDLSYQDGGSFGDINMYTDFNAINSGAATVSPKDLLNGGDSVPPSTAFTNLTTPGSTYLDTPDSYQASPLFSDDLSNSFDFGGVSNANFFPELDTLMAAPPMERTISSSSAAQIVVHPGGPSHVRKRSSATNSPALFHARPSSVAGVAAKKRDKPLPPIMVDENDSIALKRARNTAAARKSRAKKVEERDVLEGRIADLEAALAASERDRDYWKAQAQAEAGDELED
nr:hypothetical protein B0A51_11164 [Rachicladosporium sp. CCFEE 5018]